MQSKIYTTGYRTGKKGSKTKQTVQAHPKQVENSAGGFSFALDKWKQVDRFLILGTIGGTYYVEESKLTKLNTDNLVDCIKEDGLRFVKRVIEVSDKGLAFKNDPAIFALALATVYGNTETKSYVYSNLNSVCRIPTHLFHFVEFVNQMRGWGMGLRKAVFRWYLSKSPEKLVMDILKYQSRDGWSHLDVLRLCHPKSFYQSEFEEAYQHIFDYIVSGYPKVKDNLNPKLELIHAFERAKEADVNTLRELVVEHKFPRELIPTDKLNEPAIWKAVLPNMGLTAIIRNLGNMSRANILKPLSEEERFVIERINNEEQLVKARIHPLAVLIALKTYAKGSGFRGSNTWDVNQKIVDALNKTFYQAFKYVEPSGKKFLLACDVSGSMSQSCHGTEVLSCCEATGALALTIAKTEVNYHIMAFCHNFVKLDISPNMRLDNVVLKMSQANFGGTNCALPMKYALRHKLDVDVFVVLTDNETWAGNQHPHEALNEYRNQINKNAKLVVVGMAANNFSIADPNDSGMLDVCGFDASLPSLLSYFASN